MLDEQYYAFHIIPLDSGTSTKGTGPIKYLGDDVELKALIEVVNGVISQVYERCGSKSPKFNLDI